MEGEEDMKNMLAIIGLAALLCGCSDGYNSAKCRQAVVGELNTSEVQEVPNGNGFRFIARLRDGSVWYVECMGEKAEITAKTILFAPQLNPSPQPERVE